MFCLGEGHFLLLSLVFSVNASQCLDNRNAVWCLPLCYVRCQVVVVLFLHCTFLCCQIWRYIWMGNLEVLIITGLEIFSPPCTHHQSLAFLE